MGETRIDLGLAGPRNEQQLQPGTAPYAAGVGDITVDGEPVLFWRFRAPAPMVATDVVLYCANVTCADGQVMVEAYLNGKYAAEIPLRPCGVAVGVPVVLDKMDLVELRMGKRGGGTAQITDMWITFMSRKA